MFDLMFVAMGLAVVLGDQPAAPHITPAFAGDCSVTVVLSGQRRGDVVRVLLDFGRLEDRLVGDPGQKTLEVPTGSALQKGQTLRLLINESEIASADVQDSSSRPSGQKPTGVCVASIERALDEESFAASAYFGWAFDQFAPDSIGGYPPNTTTARHSRVLYGMDFDYRLFGTDESNVNLWVAGETLHGVRSADIDCSAEKNKPEICNPRPGIAFTRAVLENQTSIEAYLEPRLEFATLQAGSSTPTSVFIAARFGFVGLDHGPRVFKNHQIAAGLLAEDGPFKDSSIQIGWGMNELLSGSKWKRLKIDGLLTFALDGVPGIRDKANFFIEMVIDNDLRGSSPDCVQTFMGFDLDVRKFFAGR